MYRCYLLKIYSETQKQLMLSSTLAPNVYWKLHLWMHWTRLDDGRCISTNSGPGCSRLPKALGAFQLMYVLPQSWPLALCYKRGNRCATACSAESPEDQVPLAFTKSWSWSHFKMLISCTQCEWGCLGFWACKRYTDNFTHGTSESCLNYSVLLQTPVKTSKEIRNDF